MAAAGRPLALVFLLALLVTICIVDARKAKPGLHIPKHHNAKKEVHRRYKLHKSPISGRTGVTLDHAPAAPVGRKLQQTGPTIPSGMTACVSAADAANFIVGVHATQMTVSNAAWRNNTCDLAAYLGGTSSGLQWGAVTTWPADHAMAGMFGNSGALVLSSGDVTEVQSIVNDLDDFTADAQQPGDADLDTLITGYTTYDAAVLEFDVTPAKNGQLIFSYAFGSEEYNEWVDSPFNDVFGFWISGPGIKDGSTPLNVAYLPDQVTPCSINNINNGKFSQFYKDNDADPRTTTPSAHNISYDGFTTLLNTLPVDVQAGQRYHFKLAIADAGDHILDSAVWIAGGSLLVNNPPRVDTNGPFNMSCPGSVTLLGNATDDDNDALRYSWDLRSTTGAHITRLTQAPTLTNPTDAIPAGTYSVVLTAIDTHGSRTAANTTLTVAACSAPVGNRPPTPVLTGAPYTLALCNGTGSVTLDASSSTDSDVGDSIARYVWEVAAPDYELKLTGPTVTLGAAQGLFAGNVYEVEVYVSDSFGAVGVAETKLTVVPGPGCSGGGGGCIGASCNPQLPMYTAAVITGGPYYTACPAGPVTLDGSASTSADGGPLESYLWEIVDPSSGQYIALDSTSTMNLAVADQLWMQAGGTYELWLTVTDIAGVVSQDTTTVTVPVCNTPPTAAVSSTTGSYNLACNGALTLDSSGSSDADAGDAVASWAWTVTNKAGAVVFSSIDPTLTLTNTQLPAGATYSVTLLVADTQGALSAPSPKVSLSALACGQPPVAKLSGGSLSMSCGGTAKVDGTASSDPNGNDDIAGYTFYILNAAQVVVASKASTTGKADFTMADGLLSNTVYTVKLEVTDKSNQQGTANQTLTVGNCAPTAIIATPTASITCGGTVTLDGSASKDIDGTVASYAWKLVYGNTTVSKTGVTAAVSQKTDKLVSGATYQVTLTVKDDKGASGSATGTLTVPTCVNNPPVCTGAYPSVTRISTLDHSMKTVSVQNVTDKDGDTVTITITGVTQDEGTKASDTQITGTWKCPDATISTTTKNSVTLAAEALNAKATNPSGRVYSVQFTASDGVGGSCNGSVKVCAKPGTAGTCVDEGQAYTSTVCA